MDGHAASNHRSCSRAPVALTVEVLHGEDERLSGRLSDISFGGAFVEMDAHNFRPNDVVTLCFELEEDNVIRPCALSATVARADPDGVGLAFDDYDRDTITALREVYHRLLR